MEYILAKVNLPFYTKMDSQMEYILDKVNLQNRII